MVRVDDGPPRLLVQPPLQLLLRRELLPQQNAVHAAAVGPEEGRGAEERRDRWAHCKEDGGWSVQAAYKKVVQLPHTPAGAPTMGPIPGLFPTSSSFPALEPPSAN